MPRIAEALADTPVILIHGPRQCGKTTLARLVGDALDYVYLSFDEDVLRAAALADPVGFVADLPARVIRSVAQRLRSASPREWSPDSARSGSRQAVA